jgi:hypothetical protein
MNVIKVLLSLALVLACATTASAGTMYWNDDFESYANQAAFDTAWPLVSGTQPTWSTDQSTSPRHSILEPAGSPGRVVSVTTYPDNINASDEAPLVLEYDIYINPNDLTSSRRYAELRQTTGDLNIFAIGLTNLGGIDNTKFGIRNQFTWIELAADRLAGWNHVKAEINTQKINVTINNNPTESFFRNSIDDYGTLYMGSGFSNNTVEPFNGFTYIDNMSVERIPEPATLSLLALGGLALLKQRKRR